MPRKTPPLHLAEITGATFPNLAAAQQTARPALACDLAATLRGLLARGVLVVQDGKIQPNPSR